MRLPARARRGDGHPSRRAGALNGQGSPLARPPSTIPGMEVDASSWSGEGAFTQSLLDVLKALATITVLKVEDAPASRTESSYSFVSNEIYVGFAAGLESGG